MPSEKWILKTLMYYVIWSVGFLCGYIPLVYFGAGFGLGMVAAGAAAGLVMGAAEKLDGACPHRGFRSYLRYHLPLLVVGVCGTALVIVGTMELTGVMPAEESTAPLGGFLGAVLGLIISVPAGLWLGTKLFHRSKSAQ